MFQGGATRGSVGSGFGGQRGIGSGFFPGPSHSRHFHNGGSVVLPFWYDDPSGYEETYAEAAMNAPAPPVILVQPDRSPAAPRAIPPAKSLVIEVPGTANSAASKPLPPAIFILMNGDRLEARRYMLTQDNLYLTIDRQHRAIPLTLLDINATLAANTARGIDLQIPAGRNEISLGF